MMRAAAIFVAVGMSRSCRMVGVKMSGAFLLLYCVAAILLGQSEGGGGWRSMGINYGRVGDNLPSPAEAVSLIKALKVGSVKLFDSDSEVLSALANTGLSVVIAVKDEEIPGVASSVLMADEWVKRNVLAHYPATRIKAITVGNEILSDYSNRNRWGRLVPAMQNIHSSLVRWNLWKKIKVSTSVAMDALNSSSPPSSGMFREDIAETVMKPLLRFLSNSKSFYFLNAYPYFAWAANADKIALDYAVFGGIQAAVEDGGFRYTDMLSAQLDANVAAMAKLGYPNVKIAISETGWPTAGGPDEVGANVHLAATYNRRVVRRMLSSPPPGTQRRPGAFIPTYLFALFNEDKKPGSVLERNWGLLYPNGSQVYSIDMTGTLSDSDYESLNIVRSFPAFPSPLPRIPTQPILSSTSHPSPGSRIDQNLAHYYSSSPPHVPTTASYTFIPYAPEPSPVTPALPPPPHASTGSPPVPYVIPPPPVTINPPTLPAPTINYPPPCSSYIPPTSPAPYNPSPVTPINPNPPSSTPYTPYNPPTTPVSTQGLWCVAKPTVPTPVMQQAMDYACGAGAECQSIQPDGSCYVPNTVVAHASFAFNSYWQKTKNIGGTCDFGGVAMVITTDPSFAECRFVVN